MNGANIQTQETSQGYMNKITRRYTPVPTRKTQILATAYDNQESMLIRVFQGDRMMARDNLFLGELELTGIPPSPRHVPIVEVLFELDVSTPTPRHEASISVFRKLKNLARPTVFSKSLLAVSVSLKEDTGHTLLLTCMQIRPLKHQPSSYDEPHLLNFA